MHRPIEIIDDFYTEEELDDFTTNESATLLIQLWNLEGKLITTLYNDFVNEGPNRLTFNISSLKIGAYILTISQGGVIVQREKLVRH